MAFGEGDDDLLIPYRHQMLLQAATSMIDPTSLTNVIFLGEILTHTSEEMQFEIIMKGSRHGNRRHYLYPPQF